MEIKKAQFLKSSGSIADAPKDQKPEFAFIGRSNVGKSSLINMLAGNKSLAKVSSTPGKTISINHFIINDKWYLVDLPGYGFAKRSKEQRAIWEKVMFEYFSKRESLYYVMVLVDSRIEPQKIDIDFINKLGGMGIPLCIVFTKIDKNRASETVRNLSAFKKKLSEFWEELPPMISTSAVDATGKKEVLNFIDQAIKNSAE